MKGYLLRDVDQELWQQVKWLATYRDITIQQLIIELLETEVELSIEQNKKGGKKNDYIIIGGMADE